MAAHAILSASGAHRWMSCTPSARLEQTLPERKIAPGQFNYSAEGTAAHELAEALLRHSMGKITDGELRIVEESSRATEYYTDEFRAHVESYVVYVRSQAGASDTLLVEQKVDFSDWVPEGFGTADCIILSENKVRIIDLKFGMGIKVYADDNPQLRLYALGAFAKFKEDFPNIKQVEYTVMQPRLGHIDTATTTLDKLLDWANYVVKPKAKRAWSGVGEFVPGEHCGFCRAKTQCRARSEFVDEVASIDFRQPALLTDRELLLVYERAQAVRSYVADVEEYLINRAVNDNEIPAGYRVVETLGNRRITDQKLAATILQEAGFNDIYEPIKLKSCAQLEKLLPKGKLLDTLGALIERPVGKPKLAKLEEFS